MLALLALSAAMFHFDHNDRLWHMYTPPPFLKRARDGAILHARPEDGVRLVQVPVLPWGAYFPALRVLAQPPPSSEARPHWTDEVELRRCQAVWRRLTPRQREALCGLAEGLPPQQVAERMCIAMSTLHSYKSLIYDECRNAWALEPGTRLDFHFVRERFGPHVAALATLTHPDVLDHSRS